MRIKRISATELFGLFNHTIPLQLDERITIIHGPNGLGKTIILRMLAGLMEGKYSIFRRIPFGKFMVEFDSGDALYVHTESTPGQRDLITTHAQPRVVLTAASPGLPNETYEPGVRREPPHRRSVIHER